MGITANSTDVRQPRARRTREAILAAAQKRFLESGYRETSVAAIATDAGITDAGLLYHFPTKEDLLLTILTQEDQREDALLAEIYASPIELLLNRARQWGEVMEEASLVTALRASMSGEFLLDNSRINAYFRDRYDRHLAQIRTGLGEAQDRGDIRNDAEIELEARTMLAVMDGARLQYYFSDGARSIADLVRFAVDTMAKRLILR